MSSPLSFTLTNDTISVVWEGKPHTVQKGSPQFLALRKAIMEEDWESVPKNLTVAKSLKEWAKGKFTFEDDHFIYDGNPLPNELDNRIRKMATGNEDPTLLFNFWERLQRNPSYRSVQQLWTFLQHQGIPLTPDGCFLAYKSVRKDYKDHHSGQFDNRPGQINEMPRNQISDDPRVACHDGFHVGALEYVRTFHADDSIHIVVKVDPENVVCVPFDSSQHKMRVSKYEVIGNHNGRHLPSTSFTDELPTIEPSESEESEDIEPHDYDEEDPFESECDECGNGIPDDAPSEANSYHKENCSLFKPAEVKVEKEKQADGSTVVKMSLPIGSMQDLREVVNEKPKKDKPSNKEFAKLHKMKMKGLLEESIETLRKYATNKLKIVGASKIPGGKVPLIETILKVRKRKS